MGSRYIWNRAVQNFLLVGGDINWVSQGIVTAPAFLQKIGRLSGDMAFNLRGFMVSSCFNDTASEMERESLMEGLIVLAYYQSLSCLSSTVGLIS